MDVPLPVVPTPDLIRGLSQQEGCPHARTVPTGVPLARAGRAGEPQAVARLMRQVGLQGIHHREGRKNIVKAATEEDLVRRQFSGDGARSAVAD